MNEFSLFYYIQGCADALAEWIRSVFHLLFVIGFCVICFMKLTFVCILRYELKEMIQKINMLKNETGCPILDFMNDDGQNQQVSDTLSIT